MTKWNLGCGFDIKEGWFNTNHASHKPVEGAWYLDALVFHADMLNKFDYVLINHTLCVLSYEEAETVLGYVYRYLKDGGTVEVIDMNPLKSFRSYERGEIQSFPGFDGSIDNRFCKHLIGYGRKSLYTPDLVCELLEKHGFKKAKDYYNSEHDLRPKESLVVRAVKWT